MMTIFRSILILSVLALLSTAAFGQKTRIKFARGTKSAVVTGTLNGYKCEKTFVTRVLKGQTLVTKNIGKNYITIGIEAPPGSTYEQDMAADCHSNNEVNPTDAGDYTITVTECMKADRWRGTFKMRITVK